MLKQQSDGIATLTEKPEKTATNTAHQMIGCTNEPCLDFGGIPTSLSELKCLFFASPTSNVHNEHTLKELLATFATFGKVEDLSTYQPLVRVKWAGICEPATGMSELG